MSSVARLLVSAVVATVAVAGIALLSPSSSPSATSNHPGSTYSVTENGVSFSFRVPTTGATGWERFSSLSTDGGPISLNRSIMGPQGAEAIIYWSSFPDGDYADPCARVLSRSVGRSTADLAAAVSAAPGTGLVKGPLNVTLGGRPAKHVVLAVRKSVGCDPGFFYTWRDRGSGALWPTTSVGDTIRVWVVNVDGTRLFIAAATTVQANASLRKRLSGSSNRSGSADRDETAPATSRPHRLLHRDRRLVVVAGIRGRPDRGGEWRVRYECEQSSARRGDHRPRREETRTTHERRSRALHYFRRDL